MPPRLTLLFALLLLCTLAAPAALAGPKLRVRGSARLQARALPVVAMVDTGAERSVQQGIKLTGSLTDDVGGPIGEAQVRVRVAYENGVRALVLPTAYACKPTRNMDVEPVSLAGAAYYDVQTSGAGGFCVHFLEAPQPIAALEIEYSGSDYYEGDRTKLPIDTTKLALLLDFQQLRPELSLDRPTANVRVQTRVEPSMPPQLADTIELELLHANRTAAKSAPAVHLATARVVPGETASFEVQTEALGAPGPGQLIVRHAGSDSILPAERRLTIERTARVGLELVRGLEPANPAEGVEIPLRVWSSRGPVPSGSVEALVGGESVGTAAVRDGKATLEVAFDAQRQSTPLRLRFLPGAPWWHPGSELVVEVPVLPPSPWRSLPWVVAVVAVAYWVVRGWARPGRKEKRSSAEREEPTGRPSLDVLELGPAESGWRGRVLDAHDNTPISNAVLKVVVPAFEGDGVSARAEADSEGRFELAPVAAVEGARLEVSARWHASLARPLPPPGRVAVHLVTRRRALVDRLVQWARQRGRPWIGDGDGEPTPGRVASVARSQSEQSAEVWARSVEQAAYGPVAPDEQQERAVREQEPAARPPASD